MKTNDIFTFRRFGKYFASDLRTCAANYGLTLATITILVQIGLYVTCVGFTLVFGKVWQAPGIGLRVAAFVVAMLCLTITMPVKCYGRLTEKQYGSFWISIPASRLEKFLSMLILTCIIVPLTGTAIYLTFDWLICLIDKTCGDNIIGTFINIGGEVNKAINELTAEEIMINSTMISTDFMESITSPWIYIDEYIVMCLPFLLGAIFFKSAKTVKTFLAIAAISSVTGMIMTPIMAGYYIDLINGAVSEEQALAEVFNSGLFKHLPLIDTITDTIYNVGLLAGIWFRIKTLKH